MSDSMELDHLRVVITGEIGALKASIKEAIAKVKQTEDAIGRSTSGISRSVTRAGGLIKSALAVVSVAAFAAMSKGALELASDVQETDAVVDLAFGGMADKARAFADSAIDAYGMSSLSAKQTAGDYMLMSKGMGIAETRAAEMAIGATKLSADMASLKNTSQEMAKTALSGIWTGETEALKKYGVVMTQANLEAFMHKKGIEGTIQALDQQSQVALRYAYVMDSMRLAQGNFHRESQGYAAQVKTLGQLWREIYAIIGQGLMVIVLPVIRAINIALRYVLAFAKAVAGVFGKLFGGASKKAAASAEPLAGSMSDIGAAAGRAGNGAAGLGKLGNAAEKAGKKAKGALAAFDELNVLSNPEANSSAPKGGGGSVGSPGVGGAPVDIAIPDYAEIPDKIKAPEIDTSGIERGLTWIVERAKSAGSFLKEHWAGVSAAIAGGLAGAFAFNHAGAILGRLAALKGVITHPILALKLAWINMSATASSALAAITSPAAILAASVALIVAAVVYLWQTSERFRDSVMDTFGKIAELFGTIGGDVYRMISDFIEQILPGLSEGWQNFANLIEELWVGHLKPIVDLVIDMLSALWTNILQPLLSGAFGILGDIINIVMKLWNKVLSPFVNFIVKATAPLTTALSGGMKAAWELISQVVGIAVRLVTGAIRGVLSVVSGLLDFVVGIFTGGWEGAWKGVSNIVSSVWDGITGLLGGFGGWIWNNVIEPVGRFFADMWHGIYNTAAEAWGWIVGLFSKGGEIFGGIVDGIGGFFTWVINRMIDGINFVIGAPFRFINGILNGIRNFNILGQYPFWGMWGADPIPIPSIPYLSVGTNYVAREGMAYIHEGEAVVPKRYNPAAGGGMEQIELLKEQNGILRALLEKDNGVYLDGEALHSAGQYRARRDADRFGYAY